MIPRGWTVAELEDWAMTRRRRDVIEWARVSDGGDAADATRAEYRAIDESARAFFLRACAGDEGARETILEWILSSTPAGGWADQYQHRLDSLRCHLVEAMVLDEDEEGDLGLCAEAEVDGSTLWAAIRLWMEEDLEEEEE